MTHVIRLTVFCLAHLNADNIVVFWLIKFALGPNGVNIYFG